MITLLEMAFTKKVGLDLSLDKLAKDDLNSTFFSEEAGIVIQVAEKFFDEITHELTKVGLIATSVGEISSSKEIVISSSDGELFRDSVINLEKYWREVSHSIQSIRDNESVANSEIGLLDDINHKGLFAEDQFNENDVKSFAITNNKPKVAILREQGVNGQMEMAAAFDRAGFTAVDLHMSDLMSGRSHLAEFNGVVACGGFSYGDVLGAGEGWAKGVLFDAAMSDQFQAFFEREDSFALGVCNGCQMLSALAPLIPGTEHWPRFARNLSEQYEARLVRVRVEESASILTMGMGGSELPIVVAHGEGRAQFSSVHDLSALESSNRVSLRYIDNQDQVAATFPANPNGSPNGVTGLCNADGRVNIMMPHPERVFRTVQMSWAPADWPEDSGWMRLFRNARVWVD